MFSLPQYEKTRNILMIVFFLQTAKTNLNCTISVDESLHKVFSVSVIAVQVQPSLSSGGLHQQNHCSLKNVAFIQCKSLNYEDITAVFVPLH